MFSFDCSHATKSSILTQTPAQSSPKHIKRFLPKASAQPKHYLASDFTPSLLCLLLDLKEKIPCNYQHNNTLLCFVLELAPFSLKKRFTFQLPTNFLFSNGVPHLLPIYNSLSFARLEASSLAERSCSLNRFIEQENLFT